MDQHGGSGGSDSTRRWIAALLAIGLVVRLVAAWASPGIMHPDEHQQYIEQSFRLVHGYGATFWEQDCGLRHPLFTTVLAGILWAEERLGISDPLVLAAGQRLVLASFSFGALATLVWSVYARGRPTAALVLAVLLAGSVDLVFIQVRVMSENASIAVLALALACRPNRPLAAGLLSGVLVAIRLQTAPLAAGLWAVSGWEAVRGTASGCRRRWLVGTFGLAIALIGMGGMDAAVNGAWFHSARINLRLQALGDVASSHGTRPVYAYLLTNGLALIQASVIALPALIVGARRRPALAAAAGLFFLAHSVVPHKESRYLWPMAPIVGLLIAAGIEEWHRRRPIGRPAAIALVASLLAPSLIRVGLIQWRTEPYAASASCLALAGRFNDVHGVALIGVPRFVAGNYFYLRNPAPIRYVGREEQADITRDPDWQAGRLNYVVAPRAEPAAGAANRITVRGRVSRLGGVRARWRRPAGGTALIAIPTPAAAGYHHPYRPPQSREPRMDYRVDLPEFHGPLDLLLYLVKKNEVDVRDIPIATIAEQFRQYLDILQVADIELAGDFLVMAATLMEIKSRMLLPQAEIGSGEPTRPTRGRNSSGNWSSTRSSRRRRPGSKRGPPSNSGGCRGSRSP